MDSNNARHEGKRKKHTSSGERNIRSTMDMYRIWRMKLRGTMTYKEIFAQDIDLEIKLLKRILV